MSLVKRPGRRKARLSHKPEDLPTRRSRLLPGRAKGQESFHDDILLNPASGRMTCAFLMESFMKRLFFSSGQIALLTALLTTPAFAQSLGDIPGYQCQPTSKKTETPPNMDEIRICDPLPNTPDIIVTGTRIGALGVDRLTAPVSVLTDADIEARGQSLIADLLRTIPGAAVNRSGPQGSLTQLRLRGSEGNHVLVLVDGVEVSNPNTGEFDFGSLRAEDVERIEVLRGEQSALWGSDAIGGVVNIITRAGETHEGYILSLEGGSFNTLEGQISGVIPLGKAALSVNGNAFRTDGYDVSGLNGEKDGAKSRAVNLGLNGVDLGPVSLSGKFSTSHAISGFDSDTDFDGRLNNTHAVLTTDSKTARLSGRFDTSDGIRHLINLAYTDTKQNTTGTGFRNDTTGKRTQANWAAKKDFGAHSLTLLGEVEREDFSNFGGPGAFQNQSHAITNKALAADWNYHKNALSLSGSARADFNDRFKNSQTWRIGAGYKFENFGGRIRASVGTGIKNPTMTELFGFFPGSFTPNPDLKPETSTGYDIGWEQKLGTWKVTLDYFHSDLKDEIYTVFNPNFTSGVANRANKSTREGVEVEARGNVGETLRVYGSMSFLNAKENGLAEIRRPKFLASGTLNWQALDRLALSLSADHTGSQFDTDFATFSRVKLKAYTLVGLNARYAVNDHLTFSIRGENLLDENYQEVVGYASQGRGIYAGLKANF